MGFYLRKALKFGPVRLNLSRSGLGVSVGVKGARIGVSPKGNYYVHAGRGGLYYRQNLGTLHGRPGEARLLSDTELLEVESRAARDMQDTSSMSLLKELNRVESRISALPFAIIGFILMLVGAGMVTADKGEVLTNLGFAGAVLLGIPLILYARHRDVTRQLTRDPTAKFDSLVNSTRTALKTLEGPLNHMLELQEENSGTSAWDKLTTYPVDIVLYFTQLDGHVSAQAAMLYSRFLWLDHDDMGSSCPTTQDLELIRQRWNVPGLNNAARFWLMFLDFQALLRYDVKHGTAHAHTLCELLVKIAVLTVQVGDRKDGPGPLCQDE